MGDVGKEQVFLITGAAAGIGRATAVALAGEDAALVLTDIDLARVEETAHLVGQRGSRTIALRVDISAASEVDNMIESAVAHFDRLDHAFNNAGVSQSNFGEAGSKLGDITEETFGGLFAVNVIGTWLCMRAELRQMQRQGRGSILNTASVVGFIGRSGAGVYAASKHAVIGLTKSAAIEYADANIRVNCLCPGFIDTDFLKSSLKLNGERLIQSVPMGRLGTPADIAEMAVWLMSDHARYVTGAAMIVDGGFLAT